MNRSKVIIGIFLVFSLFIPLKVVSAASTNNIPIYDHDSTLFYNMVVMNNKLDKYNFTYIRLDNPKGGTNSFKIGYDTNDLDSKMLVTLDTNNNNKVSSVGLTYLASNNGTNELAFLDKVTRLLCTTINISPDELNDLERQNQTITDKNIDGKLYRYSEGSTWCKRIKKQIVFKKVRFTLNDDYGWMYSFSVQ